MIFLQARELPKVDHTRAVKEYSRSSADQVSISCDASEMFIDAWEFKYMPKLKYSCNEILKAGLH